MPKLGGEILVPKLVALDSSHIGAVAADAGSNDKVRRQRAEIFERDFKENGNLLLLSWHHLQELFTHQNDEVVAKRIEHIRSMPLVAALASFSQENIIGTIVDLQCFEVAVAFRNSTADVVAVRNDVAKGMFWFTSGSDIIAPFLHNWSELRASFAERERKNREVVAISHSNFPKNSDAKIVDFLKGNRRSLEDVRQQLQHMHSYLASDIRHRGDDRINDPDRTSQEFIDEVLRISLGVIGAENPALKILEDHDIQLSDIGSRTTLADVGGLAVFRQKLRVLNRNLRLPLQELFVKIQENRLPSGVIYNAIRRYHPDTGRWDGSELADRHLACLSAYADVTYVDKRTHEASLQARRKSKEFASLVHRIEKASEYSQITRQLAC